MKEAELSTQGEIIAVDGKTVRRSYDDKGKQGAIHIVSAFAAENDIVLGHWVFSHNLSLERTLGLTNC